MIVVTCVFAAVFLVKLFVVVRVCVLLRFCYLCSVVRVVLCSLLHACCYMCFLSLCVS